MNPPITLAVADGPFEAGDELGATVTVSGEDATGVRAELFYVNAYLYRGEDTSTTGSSNDSMLEMATDIAVDASSSGPELSAESTVVVASFALTPGDGPLVGEHDVRLRVPEDAPPSAGDSVLWRLRAMVDRAVGAHDEVVEDVTVVTTPARVGAETDERVYGDGQLSLVLSSAQALRAGETITGILAVTTEKSAKFTDLRVRLEARRADEDSIEHLSTVISVDVAGKTSAEAGVRHELPFSIQVPADIPPTFVAQMNRLDYKLVATGARRLRSDFDAKLRVYIASPAG